MHGALITAKVVNGEIHISIYIIYEFYVQVTRGLPEFNLIDISHVVNMTEFSKYLGLDSSENTTEIHLA